MIDLADDKQGMNFGDIVANKEKIIIGSGEFGGEVDERLWSEQEIKNIAKEEAEKISLTEADVNEIVDNAITQIPSGWQPFTYFQEIYCSNGTFYQLNLDYSKFNENTELIVQSVQSNRQGIYVPFFRALTNTSSHIWYNMCVSQDKFNPIAIELKMENNVLKFAYHRPNNNFPSQAYFDFAVRYHV